MSGKSCWWDHAWSQWSQYEQRVQVVIANGTASGERTQLWQTRSCTRCAYREDELVKELHCPVPAKAAVTTISAPVSAPGETR